MVNMKDILENIMSIITDKIDNVLKSIENQSVNRPANQPNILKDDEISIMKHIIRFHTSIKSIPLEEANIVTELLAKYPTFINHMADFIMRTPISIEKKAYVGLSFIIQTLLDKGVQKEQLILSPNHDFKLALRHHLQQITSYEEFQELTNEDKKKFVTIWEVYADLYPEEEDIVMLLENLGYHG
jgi:hypothetical protein